MELEKLRQARRLLDLTQQELGRRCRLSQAMISAFETGRLIPGHELQCRLASALGQSQDFLFGAGPEDEDEDE